MQKRKKQNPFTLFQKFTVVSLAAGVFLGGAWAFESYGGTVVNLTLSTQQNLEDGLMLHWTFDGPDFDESLGSAEVRDRSGNAKHGDAIFPAAGGGGGTETIQDMLVYRGAGSITIPEYKRHNNTDGFGIEGTALDVNGGLEWVIVKAHPSGSSDEKVLCTKVGGDNQWCQVWDGSTWADLQELEAATTGDGNSRSYDLCYEQSSGHAHVFYMDAGTDANVIYYRVWNGSVWSDQTSLQDVAGTIQTIRCVPERGTDYIAVMAKDITDDVHAVIWDGSSNIAYSELDVDASAVDVAFTYHGAWESATGDFIMAYYADVDHAIDGNVWTRGTGGDPDGTFTKVNDIIPTGTGEALIPATEITYVEMRANPDPNSQQVLLIVHDDDDQLEYNVWDGSSWGTAGNLVASGLTNLDDNSPFDLAFEYQSFDAVVTYGITSTALKYRVFSSGSWGDELDLPSTGLDEDRDWHQLASDPNSDRIMLTTVGTVDNVDTLEWSGSAWEASWTSQEVTSNDTSQNAWFVYDNEAEIAGGTTVVPGAVGQALDFDGVDDYVAGGDVDGGVAPRTVAFWMKAATTTANQSLVHLDYSNADYITTDASGNITANGFTADAIYVDDSSASANIPDLDWHHVVVVLPSGLAADDFSIASTTSAIKLFGGAMDDVRVYSKVLSADEITRLYGLGGTTKVNTTVNTQPTLQTGLVGHWTFDGPDIGPNIRDRSGQGNHGNLNHGGSGTTTRPGVLGQALRFSKTAAAHINAGNAEELSGDPATYAVWLKPDADDTETSSIFSKLADPWNAGVYIRQNTSAGLEVYIANQSPQLTISDFFQGTAGQWVHVAVVIDDGTIKAYKDGVFMNQAPHTGTATSTFDLLIGYHHAGGSRYFAGLMDDARVYNRALSQDEITRLYKLGATTKLNTTINTQSALESGLVGHWTFDGPNIDLGQPTAEIRDRSGQGNHGDWRNHASTTRPGRLGQGIDFDGTDDDVNVGDAGSGIKTISFWMRADDNTSRKVINIDGTDQIELDGSGIVTATSFPGTTVIYVDNSSASAQTTQGQWHHVVITDTTGVNASSFTIGSVSSSYFDGLIDDVRIYDRALSAAEIQGLYKLGAN